MNFDGNNVKFMIRGKNSYVVVPKDSDMFEWIVIKKEDNLYDDKIIFYIFFVYCDVLFGVKNNIVMGILLQDMYRYLSADNDVKLVEKNLNRKGKTASEKISKSVCKVQVGYRVSDNRLCQSLLRVFILMHSKFYGLPTEQMKIELKKFEKYAKLKSNIMNFDLDVVMNICDKEPV